MSKKTLKADKKFKQTVLLCMFLSVKKNKGRKTLKKKSKTEKLKLN